MRFQCPGCGSLVAVENSDMGTMVQCGSCSKIVNVPSARVCKGALVGDFIIEQELGRGGMGVVYKAHQISLDRPAALKVLSDAYANNAEFVVGFIKEARAAAKLNHPHIVQAYAVGEDEGVFYLAMEYIDGETMKGVLKREKMIPVIQAINIIQQIAEALSSAWNEQKLIHRDIKPDNIMLTSNGRAKLADLGLARTAGDIDDSEDDEVMGTPQYICPEHLTGAPMDVRSDIYSLGATFFHFVTGRFPFEGKTGAEIAQKHITDPLPPPDQVNPELPSCVARIIEKMMAKNPLMRYQEADALVDDLREARKIVESGGKGQMRLKGGVSGSKTSMNKRVTQTGSTGKKTGMVPPVDSALIDEMEEDAPRSKKTAIIIGAIAAAVVLIGGGVAGVMMLSGDSQESAKKPVAKKQVKKEPTTSPMTKKMNEILAYADVNKKDVAGVRLRCEEFLNTFEGPKIKAEEELFVELIDLYSRADELLLRDVREGKAEEFAKTRDAENEKLEKEAERLKKQEEARIAREKAQKAELERRARIAEENKRIAQQMNKRLPAERAELAEKIFEACMHEKFKTAIKAVENWKSDSLDQIKKQYPNYAPYLNGYYAVANFLIATLNDLEEINDTAFAGKDKLEGVKIRIGGKRAEIMKVEKGRVFYKTGSIGAAKKIDDLPAYVRMDMVEAAAKKLDKASRLHFYYLLTGDIARARETAKDLSPEAKRESDQLFRFFSGYLNKVWNSLPDRQKKYLREKCANDPLFKHIVKR